MSNEITVQSSLQIRNGSLFYQSRPSSFQANMTGIRGPTPGSLHIPVSGIDVALSELDRPGGLCRIMNVDPFNYASFGIRDTASNRYFPLGELLPGESYVLRLSRILGQDYGTGTGSTPLGQTGVLHMKAPHGAADVIVEAFDA